MHGQCTKCQIEGQVWPNRQTKELLCQWCQRQSRPVQRCSVCGEDRADVYTNSQTNLPTCGKCYKRTRQPRPPCSRCHHPRIVAFRDAHEQPVCAQCARNGEYREKCIICGQKRMVTARTEADEPICSLCHQTFRRLITCVQCHQRKSMGKKIGPDEYLCHACTEKGKKGICPVCGFERTLANRLNGQNVCRMCKWNANIGICARCHRERPLHVGGFCGGCYGGVRRRATIERIQRLSIGMTVYHQRTTKQGRIRAIKVPINKRGKPVVLRTQLMIDLVGHRPESDLFWPAIHCRLITHKVRPRIPSKVDSLEPPALPPTSDT